MPAYTAQAPTPQALPNNSGQPNIPVDPWVLFWIAISSGGTYFAVNLPKLLNSPIFQKTVEIGINKQQAQTNVDVAEKLTQNSIELQEAESRMDERGTLVNMLRDVLMQSQNGVKEQQSEILNLFKLAMEQQKIHAEAATTLTIIASKMEAIAGSIADAITSLNMTQARSQLSVSNELKKVSEGQDLAQEQLAAAVTTILHKIEVMIENQGELKNSSALLEEKFLKAIAELRGELLSAIASIN
jgi:hypothetical protein